MAIRVICPGCITSFEVDDRFAGQKGPCPKCGHTIEIPKEKLIVHEPDMIMDGGKPRRAQAGHDARPIMQPLHLHGQAGLLGNYDNPWRDGAHVPCRRGGSSSGQQNLRDYRVFLSRFLLRNLAIPSFATITTSKCSSATNDIGARFVRRRLWRFVARFRSVRLLRQGDSLVNLPLPAHFRRDRGYWRADLLRLQLRQSALVYSVFAVAAIIGRGLLFDEGWVWQTQSSAASKVLSVDLNAPAWAAPTSKIGRANS